MLPEWYGEYKHKVDILTQQFLKKYIQNANPTLPLDEFMEVLKYSVQWGKRFRSVLALELYLQLSEKDISSIQDDDDIVKFMIAVEYIHSFSLIHDDLPCMDNDEYRRGHLTVWKKFWEYKAVLAGDTLNTLAFEILSEIQDPLIWQKLVKLLSKSTWVLWMIWWQIEDIYFENHFDEVTHDILEKLHFKKTGQIIIASILGAVILAQKEEKIEEFRKFGQDIGLAFQIKDDILDVEGDFEETWKSVGNEKKWFVYTLWIEKSKNQLDTLIKNCHNIIAPLKSEKLNFMVDYVKVRKK